MTGATTFLIEPSLDSGPVFGVVTETIRPTDTAGDLLGRLSDSGAALLETTLDGIADGTLAAVPQPAEGMTVAPKITVEEARVRWDLPAHVVDRRIRAVTPNPGAWTMIGDLRVKVGPVTVSDRDAALNRDAAAERDPLPPGVIRVERAGVLVGTASQPVLLGRDTAAGQEGDAGRRLGSRRPSRRERTAPNEPTEPAQAPPQTPRSGPSGRIRRTARRVRARRVRQPGVARHAARARDHRPRRRIRHRADLRHLPCPRPARRRHRQRGEPARRSDRPGAARPAAARRLSTAADAGRRPRRGGYHRRAGCNRIRHGACGFRQRRAAHHLQARRGVVGRGTGATGGHRPGRAHRVRARPPAMDRAGVRRRARRGRGPAGRTAWPATTSGRWCTWPRGQAR